MVNMFILPRRISIPCFVAMYVFMVALHHRKGLQLLMYNTLNRQYDNNPPRLPPWTLSQFSSCWEFVAMATVEPYRSHAG